MLHRLLTAVVIAATTTTPTPPVTTKADYIAGRPLTLEIDGRKRPYYQAPGLWEKIRGRSRDLPERVRARKIPDVLKDGTTPYYEVDPARSVWTTTGYGQFRGDLVQRVLRGDLHRA
jgi:hypothetical protein